MKRISFLAALLLLSAYGFSQVPNGTFESWTPYGVVEVPTSWKTTDSISHTNRISQNSATREITDVQSGAASLNLASWTYFIDNSGVAIPLVPGLPGCASNGDVVIDLAGFKITPTGGSPDPIAHGALNGYYKYTPNGTDTASVEVALTRYNSGLAKRDTVGSGVFKTTGQSAYTKFSIIIGRNASGNPDSSLIWIQSSPRAPIAFGAGPGKTGSVFLVDSLYFSSLIGIDEASDLLSAVSLYPVPAVSSLTIRVELKKNVPLNYSIYDIKGQLVASDVLEPSETSVDVSHFANGSYYLSIFDPLHSPVYSSSFNVNR